MLDVVIYREARCREHVLAEYQEALGLGIRAVPAVTMAGRSPIVGAVPYPEFKRAIDAALRGARGA